MSNLSDLIPAGGGQNNTDFVASGAIASGKPVILNSNGTATEVAETTTTVTQDDVAGAVSGQSLGNNAEGVHIAWDSGDTDKFVAIVSDVSDSRYLKAWVGTVSNSGGSTSISHGTAVNVTSFQVYIHGLVACPNNAGKFFATYTNENDGSGNTGWGVVLTINGTSVDVGTPVKFTDSNATGINDHSQVVADPNVENQFLIVYRLGGSPYTGRALVATLASGAGTTITYGSEVDFESGTNGIERPKIFASPKDSGKFIVTYRDDDNSSYGTAKCISLSGTTVTGSHTAVVFMSATNDNNFYAAFNPDTAGQFLVMYGGYGTTGYSDRQFQSKVGTLSGNTVTFGSVVEMGSDGQNSQGCSLVAAGDGTHKFLACMVISGQTDHLFISVGTIASGAVTWGTRTENFSSLEIYESHKNLHSASDPNNFGRVATIFQHYQASGGTPYQRCFITEVGGDYVQTNLTSTNLLGIASAAISNTATGTINTWGSRNEAQSSLTINSDYYVQEDGTITTTSTSPAQLIGKAISATQINIKDYTG